MVGGVWLTQRVRFPDLFLIRTTVVGFLTTATVGALHFERLCWLLLCLTQILGLPVVREISGITTR